MRRLVTVKVDYILAFSSLEAALLLVSYKNRDLWEGPFFLSMRRVIVSFSQPIRFVSLDSEHAQNDGKSVIRGPPVLDLPRGWS